MNQKTVVIPFAAALFLLFCWGTCFAAAVPRKQLSLKTTAGGGVFTWLKKNSSAPRCPSQPYAIFETPPAEMRDSLTMDDLIAGSNLIIDGMVKRIEACTPPRAGGMIVTYVTFAIVDVIAGDYPAEASVITLPFIGGCAGGYCEEHEGQPQWGRRDRAILFLRQGRPFPTASGTKGIFFVTGEGQITNYDGQPLISTAPKNYAIDFTVPPARRSVDTAISGGIEVTQTKKGTSRSCIECDGHIDVAIPMVSGTPVSANEFIRLVRERRETLSSLVFPPVRIVPAGTGFEWVTGEAVHPIGGGL